MKKRILSFLLSIITVLSAIAPASFAAAAADFTTQLRDAGFSESYIPALIELHGQHPNWSFKPLITNENFYTAVDNERKPHSQQLIQKWSGNDGKGYYCQCSSDYKNGEYVPREGSSWISASEKAVQYYMDPRNFLNEQYIFQFLSTEYNSSHNQSGVEAILKGTWMYNANITYKDASGRTVTYKDSNGNTVKYSKAIMTAAKDSGLSAYYLASKIVQEVGGAEPTAGGARGTGNDKGNYKGIYNYYNINATTGYSKGLEWAAATSKWRSHGGCNMREKPTQSSKVVVYLENPTELTYIETTSTQSDGYKWIHASATVNGKKYTGYIREDLVDKPSGAVTYNRPWINPYLSIYNGAQWIADNYRTQNTGYLQKFNVNPASSNRHSHEYMANVQAAASEGNSVYKAYKNNGLLDEKMTFVIPVYLNMPVGNLSIPQGITLSNEAAGVKVSWNNVKNAEQYTVFRKNGSSGWTPLGNTQYTSYVDKSVKSNTKYYYSVCCTSADGKTYTSGYDSKGKSILFVSAPVISSISGDNSGTVIKWSKPAGSVNFKVYRKAGNGGWTALGTTTSASFTDKTAAKGTKYFYTVRCISADGKNYVSGYDSTGKSFILVAAPTISSLSNTETGIKISWNKPAGSQSFAVFRKTGNGKWTTVKITGETSCTDTAVTGGTNYFYTVRPITSDGSKTYIGGYDTVGKSKLFVAAPKITSVSSEFGGVLVKWSKSAGAQKYKVYRKTGSGGWNEVGATTALSFTDKTAKNGTTYTYTVRCVGTKGNYLSDFDKKGATIKFEYSASVISSITNTTEGIEFKWNNPTGAKYFRVYRKTNGSSGWTSIGTAAGTSYTDKTVKSGTTYAYTVRALSDDRSSFISGYDPAGKSKLFVAAPKITSVSSEFGGVLVKWSKSAGAQKYKVYRKTGSGGWNEVGTTTALSFTDKTAKNGTTYTYTVRCVGTKGNYLSDFDKKGAMIKFGSASVISSITDTTEGIAFKWNNPTGAKYFRVYRKTGSSGWTSIGTAAGTSYTDKTVKSGTTYVYTVRALSDDRSSFISGYDPAGKSKLFVAAPKITSISCKSSGVLVKWSKSAGAQKYKVYRKTDSGGWNEVGATTGLSFTDKTVKRGKKYTYTVRCVDAKGNYLSDYYKTGKSITATSSPSQVNDMVQTARKEIGNKGGKKYWSWAGYKSRVPWCNIFVTWCADQLGYYPNSVPLYQKPQDTLKWYRSRNLFKSRNYIPKAGDLIFFDWYSENRAFHIGIVEKYESGRVYCIEGNAARKDAVMRQNYSHNYNTILGYATPDYGHN